tara:strand:- start:58 stop:333 length:276 start_codon:yes stop_codon:yes gene_type:complete
MGDNEDKIYEMIDVELIEEFIKSDGYFMKSEALFYSIELAFDSKKKGISPSQFLDLRTGSRYNSEIHWGTAIEIFANYLYRIHYNRNRSIH